MKLYAARHGETTWNLEKRLMGQLPGDLSERGKLQAEALGRAVAQIPARRAYASDLGRVRQTVAIVQSVVPDLEVTYDSALRERGMGEYEGRLQSEVDMEVFGELGFGDSKFGIESLEGFTERVAHFCSMLKSRADGADVILFCHNGVMNRLRYLTNPEAFSYFDFPNAELVEFDVNQMAE